AEEALGAVPGEEAVRGPRRGAPGDPVEARLPRVPPERGHRPPGEIVEAVSGGAREARGDLGRAHGQQTSQIPRVSRHRNGLRCAYSKSPQIPKISAMCGLVGIVAARGAEAPNPARLEQAVRALAHRGPD